MNDLETKYHKVIKIRAFEELILELFSKNKLSGTTHTYIGEEATAAAIMRHVTESDVVFSNHRCHGHYLAYGGPAKALLAEIMSKKSGLCQGRGGSQHIHYKNFFTNGIQGGIVPNAVGAALSFKLTDKNSNAIVFLGDGTLGQGVVYESLNIASVYSVPVVFVVEDNQYAMSTRRTDVISGDIKERISGFDIRTFEIESTDVDELDEFFSSVFKYINTERKPVCAIIHNYRLGAHSKGDDTRDPKEIAEHKKMDPLQLVSSKIGEERVKELSLHYREEFIRMIDELENDDTITISIPDEEMVSNSTESFFPVSEKRYSEAIRDSFEKQLEKNRNTIFMGEDIRDPYGGPFKTTKGLSLAFDKQIMNMPISEACMVGLAVGMSMCGLLPVVEMMFGDFITLGFDQLLNHASKYAWVYGNVVKNPMVVRVPSGAKRGYGPTHSQSLEKFLIGIPMLKVYALSPVIDPAVAYESVFESISGPTVIIENKKLYGQKTWLIHDGQYQHFSVSEINNYGFPTARFSLDPDSKADAIAITYGGMVEETLNAAYELMIHDEIQLDVVVLSQLAPLPITDISSCCSDDSLIIIVEEGTKTAGIGAEIIASCCENGIGRKYFRIATPDMPIPNGLVLENQIIPNKDIIVTTIREACN